MTRNSVFAFAFFILRAYGNQGDAFLLGEFDSELIAYLEVKHCGVCLTDEEVTVALNNCLVGEFASSFADTSGTTTKFNALGVQECLVVGSEIHPIRTAAKDIQEQLISQQKEIAERLSALRQENASLEGSLQQIAGGLMVCDALLSREAEESEEETEEEE